MGNNNILGFSELNQAFEKLLINLISSCYYKPYIKDHAEYKEMLKLTINQKLIFDYTEDFKKIDSNVLEDIHLKSLPLLEKYAIENGNYAEQVEIWSDNLLNIQKKLFILQKEGKNEF